MNEYLSLGRILKARLHFFKSLFLYNAIKPEENVWYHYTVKIKKVSDDHFLMTDECLTKAE